MMMNDVVGDALSGQRRGWQHRHHLRSELRITCAVVTFVITPVIRSRTTPIYTPLVSNFCISLTPCRGDAVTPSPVSAEVGTTYTT